MRQENHPITHQAFLGHSLNKWHKRVQQSMVKGKLFLFHQRHVLQGCHCERSDNVRWRLAIKGAIEKRSEFQRIRESSVLTRWRDIWLVRPDHVRLHSRLGGSHKHLLFRLWRCWWILNGLERFCQSWGCNDRCSWFLHSRWSRSNWLLLNGKILTASWCFGCGICGRSKGRGEIGFRDGWCKWQPSDSTLQEEENEHAMKSCGTHMSTYMRFGNFSFKCLQFVSLFLLLLVFLLQFKVLLA